MNTESLSITISDSIGQVSGETILPANPRALLVLAHGAGADMNHRFMKALSQALAELDVATLRFNFPFMEKKKGRPDPPAVAEKTVSMVLNHAHQKFPMLPLFAGGKSFGGRMTSQLLSKTAPPFLKGVIFFGFPLHAPGKQSTERAAHLDLVKLPMLFLQGTKDALADQTLMKEVTTKLPAASLKMFEGADHSFAVGKKDIIPELATSASQWIAER